MLSIKCRGVAVVLLLQALASASAFFPPPKNSPSIKTSDLSKSGLGGFDLIAKTNKKFIEGSAPPSPKAGAVVAKKVPIKKVVASSSPPKMVAVAKNGMKTNKAASVVSKSVGKGAKTTNNDEATPWFKKLF